MGQDREDWEGSVAGLAEGPERTAQTEEEVVRAIRYERGLLWKGGVALLAVLLVVVVNMITTR